jgi:hypothetical protein
VAAALALGGATQGWAASITIFQGSDPSVGPGGAHPNSDLAFADFTAATVFLNTIDFEGLTPGYFTSKTVASGVVMTTNNLNSVLSGLSTDNSGSPPGFNTTVGGSEYFRFGNTLNTAGSVSFNFVNPINAFGAYFSGIESTTGAAVHVSFSDGTAQDFTVNRNAVAGVTFFGFTDVGATISTVTISENVTGVPGRDTFGIDDVVFQSSLVPAGAVVPPVATPLPPAAWGGVALLAGLGANRLRKRR